MTCQLKHWAGSIRRPLPPGGPQLGKGRGGGDQGEGKIPANAFHVLNVLQLQGRDGGEGGEKKEGKKNKNNKNK